MTSNAYILSKMTWPEISEALKEAKIGIIPVGAQEQHGHHLSEGCDSYRAEKFSELLAEKCYPNVVVAPTITYGISPHHMDFPGTITLRPNTLISLLEDIVFSLKQHGLKKFLIINAHGGNSTTIDVAAEQITRIYDVEVAHTKFVDAAENSIKQGVSSEYFGHACEREISECLYMVPDIVRKDKLQEAQFNCDSLPLKYMKKKYVKVIYQYKEVTENGNLGDGTKASYELGESIIEEALENLSFFVNEFLNIERPIMKSNMLNPK